MKQKIKRFALDVRAVAERVHKSLIAKDKEIDGFAAEMSKKYTDEYAKPRLIELQREREALVTGGEKEVESIAERYKRDVQEYFTFRGADLTDDAKLFSTGIELPRDQLYTMAEQYKNNQTMLQLIFDYADKHKIVIPVDRASKQEALAFADTMRSYYNSVAQRPWYADLWFNDEYFKGIYEDVVK